MNELIFPSKRRPKAVIWLARLASPIFEIGVSDLFIHELPSAKISKTERKGLAEVIRKFGAKAHARYYQA
jgi:hypothetical protein